jgi:hypothetical protein
MVLLEPPLNPYKEFLSSLKCVDILLNLELSRSDIYGVWTRDELNIE